MVGADEGDADAEPVSEVDAELVSTVEGDMDTVAVTDGDNDTEEAEELEGCGVGITLLLRVVVGDGENEVQMRSDEYWPGPDGRPLRTRILLFKLSAMIMLSLSRSMASGCEKRTRSGNWPLPTDVPPPAILLMMPVEASMKRKVPCPYERRYTLSFKSICKSEG